MGVVLRAHSVRGDPHIQRNASGKVATARPSQSVDVFDESISDY